jgi:hypothetical protein
VPLPAVELLPKIVLPPPKNLLRSPPAWLVKVPLPAVELSKNLVEPGFLLTAVPLLIKVPLPAVELSKNSVKPAARLTVGLPLLVNIVKFPAVALLVNAIVPKSPVTKFCGIPELFVMPTPLVVNANLGLAVIVNALAPAPNTIPSTSVSAESKTSVTFDD